MNQKDNIAILGFGVEGKATLEYLVRHGYGNVTVCDSRVDLDFEMPEGVSVKLGEHYLEDLSEFDVIFRSPGVKSLEPEIQLAVKNGKYVTSGTDFFMEQCPCPVIGVTGTKGKGTCATLIYEILKKAGKDVYLAGNIGNPAIELLDKVKGDDLVVLEMSSFQLQDLRRSPRVAVFLNTTIDHLDYHSDRDEYMRAKEQILAHQREDAVAVLNRDYEYYKYYKPLVKGRLLEVSREGEVKSGAFEEDGKIFYVQDGEKSEILEVDEIALVGSHNVENVLPAVVVAKEFEVADEVIAEVVREFSGLPHRLEFVRELKGVKYFNDSFSTTPGTSMAAVDSFEEPTVLIAGGSDKGLNYSEWALKILTRPNLKTVILIGETAEKMERELLEAEEKLGSAEGSPTRVLFRDNLEEAVLEAYSEVEDGGVVVMSPAAASFGMFKNYKERGERFREEVLKLR